MDLKLRGRSALVLGGGKGLGAAIAAGLRAEGVRTLVVSRSAPKIEQANWIEADLTASNAAEIIYERAIAKVERIDILVCNSGGPPVGSAASTYPGAFADQFAPMFLSQMALAQRIIPSMIENQFGRILTIGSTSIEEPIDGLVISNSLRAALAAWMKTLSREVASRGVTVNMLAPGRIETDRLNALHETRAKAVGAGVNDIKERAVADIPLGRFGRPDEFAALATFLASPLASYINGECIRVDGGLARGL